ncbi:HAD family hydrolase [Achromobacter aloeverae]|uniref:HAD family hydrolase n=1 Tax=Achromobacter aloeverae TaxID=1750518 RepID=A0A4V1MRU3_9BURK|nr:HAD-IA family hydrolase [Achromobacter aloeverae]RXN86251.1 HAD family hydrolase [Achromobacter aloeverae]
MSLNAVAAISLDLDDTLWPFAPSVARAESALQAWLVAHAPKTAARLSAPRALALLRDEYEAAHPELVGDYRALRLGSITEVLASVGEDTALTQPAYDAFYAARNDVEFFEDVLPALTWLGARFPLVAVTNGNADLALTGGGEFFMGALSARQFGAAKPDAAIFHAAARMASVLPSDMLHVGDDFDLDVVGATNAGLQAAWLVRRHDGADISVPSRAGTHVTVSCLLNLCALLGRRDGS